MSFLHRSFFISVLKSANAFTASCITRESSSTIDDYFIVTKLHFTFIIVLIQDKTKTNQQMLTKLVPSHSEKKIILASRRM